MGLSKEELDCETYRNLYKDFNGVNPTITFPASELPQRIARLEALLAAERREEELAKSKTYVPLMYSPFANLKLLH
jgi:hypothetical protein